MSLNKITLIGNLGRDPEMSYTTSGTAVTNFSLAVSRNYKTAAGENKEETLWFKIVAFGKQAETCNNYLHKGMKVYVDGRLDAPRIYTDKAGETRVSLDVRLNEMVMLTPRGEHGVEFSGASGMDSPSGKSSLDEIADITEDLE